MDISLLPEELFEIVISYLEIEDVLSCCLVCKRWREAINQDRIWYTLWNRLYDKATNVKKTDLKLIETPCLVEPAFVEPQVSCVTLSEICSWRLRYMQEAHITRNWRNGKFACYEIAGNAESICIDSDDDVLITCSPDKRRFQVYGLSSTPEFIQETLLSVRLYADFLKLANDVFVVAQCTLVQVYAKDKANGNAFELKHRFIFNKSQIESDTIPTRQDINDWYHNNIGLYPSDINCDFDHNGKYFVGVALEGNLNNGILHIWDVTNGHKAAEQGVPSMDGIITDLSASIHSSNLFLMLKVKDDYILRTVVSCFDLKNFRYSNFRVSFDYVVPIFLFGEQFSGSIDSTGKTLLLWKSDTGHFLKRIACEFDIHPATLHFVPSFFFLGGNHSTECCGTIKVYDSYKFELLSEFVADHKITNLLYVRSSLVLVSGWMKIGIWDFLESTKVHTLSFCDCISVDSGRLKMLVENDDDFLLLRFW